MLPVSENQGGFVDLPLDLSWLMFSDDVLIVTLYDKGNDQIKRAITRHALSHIYQLYLFAIFLKQ